jgi:hypothetical protein
MAEASSGDDASAIVALAPETQACFVFLAALAAQRTRVLPKNCR